MNRKQLKTMPRFIAYFFRFVKLSALLVSFFFVFAGCKMPMKVAMTGDVSGNITTRLPPDNTATPVAQRLVQGDPSQCCKIAIIDIDGILLNRNFKGFESMGENPVALFHEKLEAAKRDPMIRGVVLRLNSPGGAVTACDLMRRDLLQFKQTSGKPVVTSILDTGAGGAYYIATASDLILAHPTSVVGGVGVIINIYNMSDTLQQQNIEPTPIRSGKNIDLGSPSFQLSKDGKGLLEEIAKEFHERFQSAVTQSRAGMKNDDMDGRVFTASYAKEHGFIDDVMYFDEAIRQAQMISGAGENSKVVMFRRANDRALTEFDITPNTPISLASVPLSIPGLDRAKLPQFLYLWQPEPSLEAHSY